MCRAEQQHLEILKLTEFMFVCLHLMKNKQLYPKEDKTLRIQVTLDDT